MGDEHIVEVNSNFVLHLREMFAGIISGFTSLIVSHPLDTVRVRI
jgi:hypothetical protein